MGNLCKTSPECGLAATTRPQPDGSTEVTYTVSPKTPGAFQVEYASEDGLATARYDVPATLPAGEEFITENNTPQQTEDSHFDMPDSAISTREKRASENCIDMAISANGVAYVGRGYDWNPIQNTRWREVGSATYSQHPVRVNNKDCHPVYEVQRYYGRQKITRTEYWRENYPRTVSCNGGGNGTAIPSQQSDPSGLHFSYIGPFNISSDHRCIAPDNVAYDCPNDKAFAPPPNTPGGPLYISGIPRGRWNTALRGINPNAVASNADGQHVRWGSYVNRLKSVYPNARCEGQNHGQPNAAFLNLDNLVDVYNVEASENPALNCAAANSFSVQPNTPANPLRINLIPIGETNKALNGANPNALVTKGYGRFIRWGDYLNRFKNAYYPKARCDGELAGQPNAEFLTWGDLNDAFNTVADTQPGLACPAVDAFTVSPNTPANPLNLSDISLGGMNHALSQTNPEALITNGQGQFVRWGDLLNYLKTNLPNARCNGELAGQPNAEFLQLTDLETAFNAVHTTQPGLACKSADAFTVSPNTPANPLNLSDISLGGMNHALSQTNPEALVTNGQGQFVRWGALLNRLKTNLPNASCDGDLAGQPNAEFLSLADLSNAFSQVAATQPGLACTKADNFTPPLNTPDNPLNITDISLGGFNQALGQTNAQTIVTNGQGQFVRWGDLVNALKSDTPHAPCEGEYAGQPNAEFLTMGDLNNAFAQAASAYPAFECSAGNSFIPPLNTPANPLDATIIPLGGFNEALGQTNPEALITNGQGQLVRWGDLLDSLKANNPNARCDGPLAGQPNAEFLTSNDLNNAFSQAASTQPALECSTGNSFQVEPNTPADPLNINDIPLGGFNQALSHANSRALVTNGQGQFVRWGDLLNRLKAYTPQARCEGPLTGQPNAEFLTWGDLNSAFNQVASAQPGLECTAANAFTPPDSTFVNTNNIPLGGFNQALGQTNSEETLVTNGQGQYARWGDLVNALKTIKPNARCDGPLAGQPNAEFLQTSDLSTAFNQTTLLTTSTQVTPPQTTPPQPALALKTSNTVPVTDSPQSPLNIRDIPLNSTNITLNAISNDVLITDGSDRIVRWEDFSTTLQKLFPAGSDTHCEGALSGGIHCESLNADTLNTAFNETVSEFPEPPQACRSPVKPRQLGTVSKMKDIMETFQDKAPLQLAANDQVYNGSAYAYWNDVVSQFPDSLDFYHSHGCTADDRSWRYVDNATVTQAFADADKAGAIGADNCEAYIATIDEPSIPLDVQNATALFESMAAAYSNVGLLIAEDQPVTYQGRPYVWGDIANLLPEEKQCGLSNGAESGSAAGTAAFKGINKTDLTLAFEEYLRSQSTSAPGTSDAASIAGGVIGGAALVGTASYGIASAVDGALAARKKDYKVSGWNYPGRIVSYVSNLAKYYKGSNDKHPGWTPREIPAVADGVRRMRNYFSKPQSEYHIHDTEILHDLQQHNPSGDKGKYNAGIRDILMKLKHLEKTGSFVAHSQS